jgi:hypothetical protein
MREIGGFAGGMLSPARAPMASSSVHISLSGGARYR